MSRRKHNRNKAQAPVQNQISNSDVEIRKLPIGILDVDREYQRHLCMPWAQWIADHYNPLLVDTIQVSYRDGRYWVFNGQHTMTALKIKFKDNNLPVACKIYHGLSQKDEAKLFYDFNTSKKKMSSESMIKARAAYGDETVKEFLFRTEKAGFIIDPDKSIRCKFGIQAVTTALACCESLGGDKYERMMNLIRETWNGEQWSVNRNMLNAMAIIIRVYGDEIDDKRFASQLAKVTKSKIERDSEQFRREDRRVPVAYAISIVQLYNHRLTKDKKLQSILLLDE